MSNSIKVECIFLDVSFETEKDTEGDSLRETLDNVLGYSCCAARARLSKSNDVKSQKGDDESVEKMKRDILKFIKIQDRYLALASILLKSHAFHETYPEAGSTGRHLIIDLPRTRHRKPYIPWGDSSALPGSEKEVNRYPLSISHQFPFAGSSRIKATEQSSLLVGLDIVVFEDFNPRMYDSTQEFIEVFRESFTVWEWESIESASAKADDEDGFAMLREFYLKWSVKEAYTKASGVGLGFNFATFETRLDNHIHSLWEMVSSLDSETNVVGTVVANPGTRESRSERWRFLFNPLYDGEGKRATDSDCKMTGCACVCVGPLPSDSDIVVDFQIQASSLEQLIVEPRHRT
jgi:4'-phosphopantetheinyl transferase